ncbi:MAG: HlyD family secretion protein [Dissulfurimicrobium sp.]|uniref:HlyD family secretion protein n=1 Tax=Dissulfurimicrobium sp. TaxID=2022436 RepID=UPI00404947C0
MTKTQVQSLCVRFSLIPNTCCSLACLFQAVIEEGLYKQAILVPQRGVTRNSQGDAMVMVVGAGDKVEPRIIKVIRTVDDNWLVSKGLKAGDRVILDGIQKARPGIQVKTVPFDAHTSAAPGGAPQPAETKS